MSAAIAGTITLSPRHVTKSLQIIISTTGTTSKTSCREASTLLSFCEGNPPVTSEFPSQRIRNEGFDVPFNVSLNKRLNKQSSCWWFKMPRRPCDVTVLDLELSCRDLIKKIDQQSSPSNGHQVRVTCSIQSRGIQCTSYPVVDIRPPGGVHHSSRASHDAPRPRSSRCSSPTCGLRFWTTPVTVVHSLPRPPTHRALSFTAAHSALKPATTIIVTS